MRLLEKEQQEACKCWFEQAINKMLEKDVCPTFSRVELKNSSHLKICVTRSSQIEVDLLENGRCLRSTVHLFELALTFSLGVWENELIGKLYRAHMIRCYEKILRENSFVESKSKVEDTGHPSWLVIGEWLNQRDYSITL